MCQDGSRLLSQVLLESKDRDISLMPGATVTFTFAISISFSITLTASITLTFISPSL